MMATYLIEIGLEDMPAHVVTPSLTQFATKTAAYLTEHHLDHGAITAYATPRRLALSIADVAAKQADTEEWVKGPAKKNAQDADGNWTKAAIGFARGQGMTPDDIEFRALKGVEYVYLHKQTSGQAAATVLSGLIDVVKGLTFPTRMKWGDFNFEYIRPIHWLVSLLDTEIVPMQLLDVTAGRRTQGHRFLGQAVDLAKADDYAAALLAQSVIVDPAARKQRIREQIAEIAETHDWVIDLDPDLLEEVTNLVEWPTAFAGSFDAKYLDIPEAVLITSMKDNQRYFYVRNHQGALVNAFIGVRNGNSAYLGNVVAGNEKVLTARLEDAAFFYTEDQKLTLAEWVAKLDHVSFHDKIGSMAEKMQRVTTIAGLLADHVGLAATERADLLRAASLYKFDLVTNMVGEFAELQGTMGGVYAKLAGETAGVVTAIAEQYRPISADGELPTTPVATLLAIADKLDSLMTFFAVDLLPSGSNDPYALRRQAYGIVRMIAAAGWSFDLAQLQPQVAEALAAAKQTFGLDFAAHAGDLTAFMQDRVAQYLSGEHLRHDVVAAASAVGDIAASIKAAELLQAHAEDADFKATMEALGRVVRIADKTPVTGLVSPALFDNDSEAALHDAVQSVQAVFTPAPSEANYQALRGLTAPITTYFEATMIMAEDRAQRQNRLAQLTQLAKLIHQFGDVTALIVK
ncbi:glycine--tRNA ligase subunit beta [Lacticaseibacillus nasuensis]|uniref:glycine--tRNA ligase subunit beta n=1 Tax=Lacticaseibacillus nasuensis TaxID=944671 RepID=UPI002246AB83|nr:glycine--tRNA ligase subunit beta [Lacticaseibacillus nasuensis]MCX2454867.1 glycine--tRNA ligase subunit beta [Lacticaseibacillus nasuensis]